jgi:hypothetical protein
MVSKTVIDQNLLRRELKRFESRVGMSGVPDFIEGKSLVLKIADGALSIELNKEKTEVLLTYSVEPEIALVDSYIKRSLESTSYVGGLVITAMFQDPKLIFLVTLKNQEISAEFFENAVMKLMKLWEDVRNGIS